MIRRPPRSTQSRSSAASDVYKRQMCERRFTTIERMQMTVHKRNGIEEPFSRDKVIRGVRNACKGRPVTDADLALLGQRVEDGLRARGVAEIPSEEIGLAILGPLRE